MDKTNVDTRKKSPSSSPDRKKSGRPQRDSESSSSSSAPSSSSSSSSSSLSPIEARPYDVLLGRGKALQSHKGNIRFHKIVNQFRPAYLASRRQDKVDVAAEVVQEVQRLQQKSRHKKGPGRQRRSWRVRFLKKNQSGDFWEEVSDEEAIQKASHALRGKPRNEDDQLSSSGEASPAKDETERSSKEDRDDEHPTMKRPRLRIDMNSSTAPSEIASSSSRHEDVNDSANDAFSQSEQPHQHVQHTRQPLLHPNQTMQIPHQNREQPLTEYAGIAGTSAILLTAPIQIPPLSARNNDPWAANVRIPLPNHLCEINYETVQSILFGSGGYNLPETPSNAVLLMASVPTDGNSSLPYPILPALRVASGNVGPSISLTPNSNTTRLRLQNEILSSQLAASALQLSMHLQRQSSQPTVPNSSPPSGHGQRGQLLIDRETAVDPVRSSVAPNTALIEQLRQQQRRKYREDP